MTPPRINGLAGAQQQPLRYGRTETGVYTLQVYEGTKAAVEALIPQIEAVGGLWEMQEGYGKWRLDVRYAFNIKDGAGNVPEAPQNTWELISGTVEKDILEADIAAVNAMIADELKAIRNYMTTWDDADRPALAAAQNEILVLIEGGVRSVEQETSTIRHTQTVSGNYAVKAARTNVGRLYSKAGLIAAENPPSAILFEFPDSSIITRASGIRVAYSFKKKGPNVTDLPLNKWQITQEWVYGLWTLATYGELIEAT